MKVLFISSGNSGDINVIVRNQAESLKKEGVNLSFYLIRGKGFLGYLSHIIKLRRFLKGNKFDILHAHYSLSAMTTALAKRKEPLVVSLMGSDAYQSWFLRRITKIFYYAWWDVTIVKSEEMNEKLRLPSVKVIPNGVDIERFKPCDKQQSRNKLALAKDKKIVIFVSNPARSEKNFELAKDTVKLLQRDDVILLPVYDVPNTAISDYMNAADTLLLTSKWEGSVNVVKEAMACNLPIVSTDVGDVKKNTKGVKGVFISDAKPQDLSEALSAALDFEGTSDGRERLISLGLDSKSVAIKILNIYREFINE